MPLRFVSVAGFNFSYPQLLGFGCVAVAAAIIGVLFKWTRAGTAIRAYVENPESARGLGVSPLYVSTIAWSVAALLAALAGVMLAPLTLLDSLRMPLYSVKALVAALLGGLTSLWGAILGGLLLGVTEAYFQGWDFLRYLDILEPIAMKDLVARLGDVFSEEGKAVSIVRPACSRIPPSPSSRTPG